MKKTHLFKNLFTTTLLSTLALSNIEIVNAASVTYNNANSNSTIATDPLPFNQITFNSVSNITIAGAVNASVPGSIAIGVDNSSPIFNNTVSIIGSVFGINNTNFSHSIFNKDFTASNNTSYGITNGDSMTFNAPVMLNNNNAGINTNGANSNILFNADVTANNNNTDGMRIQGTTTFNKNIYINNNNIGINLYYFANGVVTINGNVTGVNNINGDIVFDSAPLSLVFNNDTILNARFCEGN